MQYKNIKALFICCLLAFFTACEDDLPKNPTITSPISTLEMTVSGIDYLAVPKMNDNGSLANTMLLTVRVPNENATIKAIHLSSGLTTNIKAGDIVKFENDILPVTLTPNKGESYTYYIKMDYTEPAILYLVKSSDKDADGNGYYLDIEKSQRLASLNSDGRYEGFIDLTSTNWDNIGLVAADLKSMYEYDGGWWPERSSGLFTLVKKTTTGSSNFFASAGPWADWLWANDNEKIVSPGIWKFDFNESSGELNLVETQWAVSGTAIGQASAMTYNPADKIWSITTNLNIGKLRFLTIPVTDGDPILSYGELGTTTDTGYLESQGRDIDIKEAGSYKISTDFSKPPYYVYSITKN